MALFAFAALAHQSALADHGFALFGKTKYPRDFSHFKYVNPDAPKGGTVRRGSLLTFNSLNLMRFPGNGPNELGLTFDSLMVRAQDEPASFYGLLAEDVELAEDFSSLRIRLRPEARWHDGTPITADDVAFTFNTLRRHGLPSYRSTLEGVEIEVVDPTTVEFRSADPRDWRYVRLVVSFPIQSMRYWQQHDVSEATLDVPLGSGPYRLATLDVNSRVVLERDPGYWARDLAVNRGRWNFDRIEVGYYRDSFSMIEALKAGRLDIRREYSAALWPDAYQGPRVADGALVLSSFRERGAGRMDGIVFNLRRPPLDDARVRHALVCVFDADWARKTLFAGVYNPPASLYGDSELGARGPAGAAEQDILSVHLGDLPRGVLAAPAPPGCAGQSKRNRQRRANALLNEAGWTVREGKRVSTATGAPLRLEYVSGETGVERAMSVFGEALDDLGIELSVRLHDYVTLRDQLLGHNFDLTQSGFSPDFPPGGAERLGWHSENARKDGYALAGAEDAALDAAIEAIAQARDHAGITAATRAFDRVMRWRHYMIPLWRRDQIWIAHDKGIRFPDRFSLRRFGHLATLWWDPAALTSR